MIKVSSETFARQDLVEDLGSPKPLSLSLNLPRETRLQWEISARRLSTELTLFPSLRL